MPNFFPLGLEKQGIYKENLAGPCVVGQSILDKLVAFVPPTGAYLEVGCWTCSTACYIADKRRNATIIVVDIFNEIEKLVLAVINRKLRPNVSLWCGPSQKYLEMCKPNTFDVIFVDGDHHYDAALLDIQMSAKCLKKNGILCIHDYCNNWQGVKKAVDNFIKQSHFLVFDKIDTMICLKKK